MISTTNFKLETVVYDHSLLNVKARDCIFSPATTFVVNSISKFTMTMTDISKVIFSFLIIYIFKIYMLYFMKLLQAVYIAD